MNNKSRKRVIRTVEVVGVIITLVVLSFLVYGLTNMSAINNQVDRQISIYGGQALFLISFILELFPQFISPVVVLGTGILAGINPWVATIGVILGSLLGSLLGFFLGRKYMFDLVNIVIRKRRVEKMTGLMNKYGKVIVPIAAISPLPYIPIILGSLNLSWKNFIFYGLIPRAVSIALYGYLIFLF
jgi:membrane protein YqaA with SNARE-associated domain